MADEHWKDEPEAQDFPAARSISPCSLDSILRRSYESP